MRFFISENGERAANIAAVEELVLHHANSGWQVKALLENENEFNAATVLKTFNSGDADADFTAAKKYLAELVASLNGGRS